MDARLIYRIVEHVFDSAIFARNSKIRLYTNAAVLRPLWDLKPQGQVVSDVKKNGGSEQGKSSCWEQALHF